MGLWFLHVTGITDALAGGTQTQTFTYDTLDRLLTAVASGGSGGTYAKVTYDANGNMTGRTVGGQSFTLVYDAENRLVQVSGAVAASFVYDGDGSRVKGTVGGVTTVYLGGFYEKSGSAVKKYYEAGGQTVALRDGNTLHWLLTDHLGGTAVTATGTVATGELRFHPFGKTRDTSGTTPTSQRYTGQREEGRWGSTSTARAGMRSHSGYGARQ